MFNMKLNLNFIKIRSLRVRLQSRLREYMLCFFILGGLFLLL